MTVHVCTYMHSKVSNCGFVPTVSLCRASQVSLKWYQLATSSLLWMKLCKYVCCHLELVWYKIEVPYRLNQWQLSTFGEKSLTQFHTSPDGTVQVSYSVTVVNSISVKG